MGNASQASTSVENQIGRFVVVETIGSGGFGDVSLVKEQETGNLFALKSILTKNNAKSIHSELEIVYNQKLKSPFLCRVHYFFVDGPYTRILMEYCENRDLELWLKKQQRLLTEHEVINILVQIIKGISVLHEEHILHRDIKPQNILLNGSMEVKIADFGIVKKTENTLRTTQNSTAQNSTNSSGTIGFIPPEVINGGKPSTASDIFAIGCTIYFAAAQHLPFEAPTALAVIPMILGGRYSPITVGQYSTELKTLIYKMIDRDPKNRPTLSELKAHPLLQLALQTLPPRSVVPTPLPPLPSTSTQSALHLPSPSVPSATSSSASVHRCFTPSCQKLLDSVCVCVCENGHECCRECLQRAAALAVRARGNCVPCVDEQCTGTYAADLLVRLLPPEVFAKLGTVSVSSASATSSSASLPSPSSSSSSLTHTQKQAGSTRNECYVANEIVYDRNNNPCVMFRDIMMIGKVTCRLVVHHSDRHRSVNGTGFLTALHIPTYSRTTPLYGLITNNSVLSSEQLCEGAVVRCQFELAGSGGDDYGDGRDGGGDKSKNRLCEIPLHANRFRFTDPLLDCTFVQVSPAGEDQAALGFIDSPFLRTNETYGIGRKVVVAQHIRGRDLSFAEGLVRCRWGFDLLHEVSTDEGSSGSALCTVTGEVVGVHNAVSVSVSVSRAAAAAGVEKCNVGTNIHYVQLAINNLFSNRGGSGMGVGSYRRARTPLATKEKEELRKNGLDETTNPYVFVSPSSSGVTPLWFFRTNHAWYWTPLKPKDYTQEELNRCNWSVIWSGEEIRAIGGYWDGMAPAERNIRLIRWLISTGLRFLQ